MGALHVYTPRRHNHCHQNVGQQNHKFINDLLILHFTLMTSPEDKAYFQFVEALQYPGITSREETPYFLFVETSHYPGCHRGLPGTLKTIIRKWENRGATEIQWKEDCKALEIQWKEDCKALEMFDKSFYEWVCRNSNQLQCIELSNSSFIFKEMPTVCIGKNNLTVKDLCDLHKFSEEVMKTVVLELYQEHGKCCTLQAQSCSDKPKDIYEFKCPCLLFEICFGYEYDGHSGKQSGFDIIMYAENQAESIAKNIRDVTNDYIIFLATPRQ